MLSLRLIRENPAILETSLRNRQQDTAPAAKLLELDKKWRAVKQESDKLKGEKNCISMKISDAKKSGKPIEPIVKKTKGACRRNRRIGRESGKVRVTDAGDPP